MKIDFKSIDTESFFINERFLASGEKVFLVNPKHVGCKWTKSNLHFRSSVWNEAGELISASFKKFFNWDEQPDLDFKPFSLTANGGTTIVEKMDGSTLIVSKYKGELIVRTRGTIDARVFEANGDEIDELLGRYPQIAELANEDISLIFEWTSPFNQIVINYGEECDISLIGVVNHSDYSLQPQFFLDKIAKDNGFKRPRTFKFNSIKEMLVAIEALEGQEGVCVYCNKGQSIRKVKGAWYLSLHRFKNQATLENVVDLFCEYNCPSYNEFKEQLSTQFDHECWKLVESFASSVCDAHKHVEQLVAGMIRFIEPLKTIDRAEAARQIIASYGETNRTGFVFTLLNGRELDKKAIKKLIHQKL